MGTKNGKREGKKTPFCKIKEAVRICVIFL